MYSKVAPVEIDNPSVKSRPKSAFATPTPKRTSKLVFSERSNVVAVKKDEDLASFNADKIVNTAYLAKAHPDKCIGCATCMSP